MKQNDFRRTWPLGISVVLLIAGAVVSACGGGDSSAGEMQSAGSPSAAVAAPVPVPGSIAASVAVSSTGANSVSVTAATTPACGQSNSKVGMIANLQSRSHGVSGQAKVLDDCSIEIVNFNYDGGGLPDVFIYGAKSGAYASGFAIGPNLFGGVKTNATLLLKLKDGDLDKLDGISVWCVRAAVSFGDGRFATP